MMQRGFTYAFQLAALPFIAVAGFKFSSRALNGDGNSYLKAEPTSALIPPPAPKLAMNYKGSKIHVPEFLQDVELYGRTILEHTEHLQLLIDMLNDNTYEDKKSLEAQFDSFKRELDGSVYFKKVERTNRGTNKAGSKIFYWLEIDFLELKKNTEEPLKVNEGYLENAKEAKPRTQPRRIYGEVASA